MTFCLCLYCYLGFTLKIFSTLCLPAIVTLNPLVQPVSLYETYSSPGCLGATIFLQDVGALFSCKALGHRESTYNDPKGQLLNSEPFLLLPIFKVHRERAEGKMYRSLT